MGIKPKKMGGEMGGLLHRDALSDLGGLIIALK